MRAGELARSNFISVDIDEKLSSALAQLEGKKHHSALVVDSRDRYVGLLEKDSCLRSRGNVGDMKVRKVVKKTSRLEETADLQRVAQLFMANDVHILPLLDKYKPPIGIVGARDVILALSEKFRGMSVSDAASRYPVLLRDDDSVARVIEIFVRQRIRHLPVIDKNRKLMGIVTVFSLIKSFLMSPVPLRRNRSSDKKVRIGTFSTANVPKSGSVLVRNVMLKNVATVSPKVSLQAAAKKISDLGLSDLVVVEDNVPVGMLTIKDFLRVILK